MDDTIMFGLVLIGLEIAAGFGAAYWALAQIAASLERTQESTERIAKYLSAGPRE